MTTFLVVRRSRNSVMNSCPSDYAEGYESDTLTKIVLNKKGCLEKTTFYQ